MEERIDGSMIIRYKGNMLKFKEITERPQKQHEPKIRKVYIPPMDHPFKRSMYKRYQHINNNSQKEKGSQKEKELLLVKT